MKYSAIFLILSVISIETVFSATPEPMASSKANTPTNRIVSIFLSQDFLNEQLKLHMKSELLKKIDLELDPIHGELLLKGVVQVPTEELRAVNLDSKLGKFRFQVAIHLQTTPEGHLILEFPLNQTYFYTDSSKNTQDRVIVPVQMLSLALASARGYLAALSGDFATFDRRSEKLQALIKALDHAIQAEKNTDAAETLKTERESLRLKLEAVPIERKQLQGLSKEFEGMMGFIGEKELRLNDGLAAQKNALIFKIKLSQLTPYLTGVELGGVRILHDKKDGNGQNYLAIDVNADLATPPLAPFVKKPSHRVGMKVAPSIIMRLNQALFESDAVVSAEKKRMSSKLQNFEILLKEDGLHISGKWKTFLVSIPFDTIVDFVPTTTDVFEIRVGEIEVAGIDLDFLTSFVLESMKKRLDESLKGICSFDYIHDNKGHNQALKVTVDPKKLLPAFPNLHLIGVDVREREFLMKIGHPEN